MVSTLRLTFLAAAVMPVATAACAQLPSGERRLGKKIVEPGYHDRPGIATEEQLDAAIDAADAVTVPTNTIFHRNPVSASVHNRATPLPSAP